MAAQGATWNAANIAHDAQRRFCALAFRSQGEELVGPEPRTIMLVFISPEGRLRILVHPEIRNMYKGDDLEYIDALVWDLVERGKNEPDDLIKHLCSLGGIGALVATHNGDLYADALLLSNLSADLVEL